MIDLSRNFMIYYIRLLGTNSVSGRVCSDVVQTLQHLLFTLLQILPSSTHFDLSIHLVTSSRSLFVSFINMRPSVSRLFFGSSVRSSAAPRSSPLTPASAGASESTAISPAQSTGAISQWRSRLPAATAEDYPQPSSKVFSFDKMPPPPPRRKKYHAFLTSLVTLVGLGLPIWIIYSQIMQARNNTRQAELVDKIMALKHPELVGASKPALDDVKA